MSLSEFKWLFLTDLSLASESYFIVRRFRKQDLAPIKTDCRVW